MSSFNKENNIMNFADAVKKSHKTTTTNGMVAYESIGSNAMEFFNRISEFRNNPNVVVPLFEKAWQDDPIQALKLSLYLRDIRGGQGLRKAFRDILVKISDECPEVFHDTNFLELIPQVGRWDDLLVIKDLPTRGLIASYMLSVLNHGNDSQKGLLCKWLPRKGPDAIFLRNSWGMSPKSYRKTLVHYTNVVESKMCAGEWNEIEFQKVPSQAMKILNKAFARNAPKEFSEFQNKVESGEVEVNAGAIYPYEVIKSLNTNHIIAEGQWKNLPNFVGDGKILPMIDVSPSMTCASIPGYTCMDMSIALGLYCANKNVGKFKDTYLTFHESPNMRVLNLENSLRDSIAQIRNDAWGGSTNINAALELILDTATRYNIPQEEMPEYLVIFSDMQFDSYGNKPAGDLIKTKFQEQGYDAPKVVFWNLYSNDYGNVPAQEHESGISMVSGFSPSIMKSIFSGDLESFNPTNIMLDAISKYELKRK